MDQRETRTVVLLGTSHKYQYPRNPGSEKFRRFVEHACSAHAIRLIAEEMNKDALAEKEAEQSLCYGIAGSLSLGHMYCDPDQTQRANLRIQSENHIRISGWLGNWGEETIEREVRNSHSIRERYWLHQLAGLHSWPVLFICGANHIESFSRVLAAGGMSPVVLAQDWEPVV